MRKVWEQQINKLALGRRSGDLCTQQDASMARRTDRTTEQQSTCNIINTSCGRFLGLPVIVFGGSKTRRNTAAALPSVRSRVARPKNGQLLAHLYHNN